MEQASNIENILLQIVETQKEISNNMLQMRQLDKPFFVSTSRAAELLGGINVNKLIQMYRDKNCPISGIEDGKSIKIYYSSLLEYVEKTKTMYDDKYFSNVNNIMKRASVTRTEVEKYIKK